MKNDVLKKTETAIQKHPFRWVGFGALLFAVLSFGFERGCISNALAEPIKAEAFIKQYDRHIEEYDNHAGYCSKVHDKIFKKIETQGEAIHELDKGVTEVKGDIKYLTLNVAQLVTFAGGVPKAPPPTP